MSIDFNHCEEILKINKNEIKYNLTNSDGPNMEMFQYNFLSHEILGLLFIENEGKELVTSLSNRIDYIVDNLAVKYKEPTPTTFCIDWLDPLRNTGQWIPELIELAGGIEGLAEKHGKSREVSWGEVINYDPGYIFSMPCAFTMDRVKVDTVEVFSKVKDFESLQAFQNHNIYLFDGQLPSRHGPRIIDVLEGFAEILHPELFQGLSPSSLYEPCFF